MSGVSDSPGLAVVDLETSGLSSANDRILQMAVLLVDSCGNTTERWSTYVRPARVLTADLGPTHIHGIKRTQLLFAPTEKSAMARFAELTADRVVVAHNARFDMGFVRAAATRHDIELRFQGILCTLDLSRRLDPERRQLHKLADVCDRYGVVIAHAHDALHDATATAAVLPHLLREHGYPQPRESIHDLLLA